MDLPMPWRILRFSKRRAHVSSFRPENRTRFFGTLKYFPGTSETMALSNRRAERGSPSSFSSRRRGTRREAGFDIDKFAQGFFPMNRMSGIFIPGNPRTYSSRPDIQGIPRFKTYRGTRRMLTFGERWHPRSLPGLFTCF